MTTVQEPERKRTPRWVLWTAGIGGGIVLTLVLFLSGAIETADAGQRLSRGVGAVLGWGIVLVLVIRGLLPRR